MNFIASTLIAVLDDEELAFWIFLSLLINKDMKNLFLPVKNTHIIFIGSSRTTFEELLNGITHKISHALAIRSF